MKNLAYYVSYLVLSPVMLAHMLRRTNTQTRIAEKVFGTPLSKRQRNLLREDNYKYVINHWLPAKV